ncbi:phosphotransferase, partial [Saccharothrix sp. MB29]|nr:phosphotransferase [Saccharothrix sp. MB29]
AEARARTSPPCPARPRVASRRAVPVRPVRRRLPASAPPAPPGLPRGVVHGDAWRGNVVRTHDGEVLLLDFERCALGPPEWDLVSTAVAHHTVHRLSNAEWSAYCDAYGFDVTTWTGFAVLRA